jgi:hypothetical protein
MVRTTIAYLFICGMISFSGLPAVAWSSDVQLSSKHKMWVPRRCHSLDYPAIPLAANIDGAVLVRVTVDSRGQFGSANVLQGDRLLADAAVENLKTCQFAKGFDTNILWSGDPIVVYIFNIGGVCASATGHCATELTYPAPGMIRIHTKAMPAMPVRTK